MICKETGWQIDQRSLLIKKHTLNMVPCQGCRDAKMGQKHHLPEATNQCLVLIHSSNFGKKDTLTNLHTFRLSFSYKK